MQANREKFGRGPKRNAEEGEPASASNSKRPSLAVAGPSLDQSQKPLEVTKELSLEEALEKEMDEMESSLAKPAGSSPMEIEETKGIETEEHSVCNIPTQQTEAIETAKEVPEHYYIDSPKTQCKLITQLTHLVFGFLNI